MDYYHVDRRLGQDQTLSQLSDHLHRNGIRLILIELGFAVGKAEEPTYPYRTSLNTQRPLMLIVMVLSAILILAGGYNIFFFAK